MVINLLAQINFGAVAVAAVVYYIIGFLWYSKIFSTLWAAETGVKQPDKPVPLNLIGQFISTFLYTLGVALLMQMTGEVSVKSGIMVALLVTVVFVIPINSGNLFFTNRKKLFLLDVSERALGSVVVGVILGVWF